MPHRTGRVLLPLLLILLQPVAAAGQATANTLHPGDEVRVHAPTFRSGRVRGTVVLYQGATLDIRDARTGTVLSIPIASIRSLARNQGIDRGRSSWRMARLGAFLGGAAGLVSGPLIATSRAPKRFGEVMLVSGVVGTLAGGGAGAMLGAVFPRNQWQRFRTPIVPVVAAGPASFSFGVAASLP